MSLHEVYRLAHSAECRLHISTDRPDRNLRVVVGHLLHYESLRLRIVEIEHDISMSKRAQAVQFRGTGHVDNQQLKRTISTGQLKRFSPPPAPAGQHNEYNDEDEDEDALTDSDDADMDEDVDDDLSLSRFEPGGPHPPPLVTDTDEMDYDDDASEPQSPEDPDPQEVEQALKGHNDDDLARSIEKVRNCHCHPHTASPEIEHIWALPPSSQDKPGVTRAVAQVLA